MNFNAMIPSKFAVAFGKPVARGPKGNAIAFDTGEPVKPICKKWAVQYLKANEERLPRLFVSGKSRTGTAGKPLRKFLIEAVNLSHKQGYLTLADLAQVAGLTTVNYGVGNKSFKELVNTLVMNGCITERKRGPGSVEEAEATLDVSDVEVTDDDLAMFD